MFTWIDVGLRQMLDTRFAAPLWIRLWVLVTALAVALLRDSAARLLLPVQRSVARKAVGHLGQRIDDPGARHLWMNMRMGEVVMSGLLEDGVLDEGFDRLDEEELSGWLKRHGATEDLLDSPFVRSGYDAVFAFVGGQRVVVDGELVPCMAAGASLRSLLRAYSYRHSAVWKMRSGMGDVVVMPVYEALRQRGVAVKFFHRVCQLEPSAAGDSIERIRLVQQVQLVDPHGAYQPIVTIRGLPCWSSEPDYAQLANGPAIQVALERGGTSLECPPWLTEFEGDEIILERGTHFDDAVLGISVGGLAEISPQLAQHSPGWRRMIDCVTTTPTLGVQWWLNVPLEELGWDARTFDSPIVTGLVEPIDTWADMSHLVEREDWAERRVRSIAYFCGPLVGVDESDPAAALASVHEQVRQFVRNDLAKMWPSTTPDKLFQTLVAPPECNGPARLEVQHYRANVSGSQRYVQTRPGSTQWRLAADRSGFQNLFLAGDWTRNGLDLGCAEAAVMSGMQAARGIARDDPRGTPITVWAETDRPG
jgi:uncharacterized protein with NAD-binding domain and iron-sulfur cluster